MGFKKKHIRHLDVSGNNNCHKFCLRLILSKWNLTHISFESGLLFTCHSSARPRTITAGKTILTASTTVTAVLLVMVTKEVCYPGDIWCLLYFRMWMTCKNGLLSNESVSVSISKTKWDARCFQWHLNDVWAAAWQNEQNDLCSQRRLRSAWASAQSDLSLRCPDEETLGP